MGSGQPFSDIKRTDKLLLRTLAKVANINISIRWHCRDTKSFFKSMYWKHKDSMASESLFRDGSLITSPAQRLKQSQLKHFEWHKFPANLPPFVSQGTDETGRSTYSLQPSEEKLDQAINNYASNSNCPRERKEEETASR